MTEKTSGKLDQVFDKLSGMFDQWLEEFEASPVRTTVKVLLILYVIKWARKNLV